MSAYAGFEDLELVLPAINATLQRKVVLAILDLVSPCRAACRCPSGTQTPPHVTLFPKSLTASTPRQTNSVARQSRSSSRWRRGMAQNSSNAEWLCVRARRAYR